MILAPILNKIHGFDITILISRFFLYFAGRTVKMVWNSTQTPPTFSSFGGKRCSKTRREWCTIEAKRYHTYFPYEVQIYLVFWITKRKINFSVAKISYRPGQPNWEYTMRKLQDFSGTRILREINFGHFEAPKTAILTIWAAVNFEFLGTIDISKCEIFLKIKIDSL